MTIYDDEQSAELLAAELQAEIEESATDPTTAQPATPGLDPDAVERELDLRVRDGASYNPRAFVALQIADRLVAEVRRLRAERDTAPAAPAAPGCTCPRAAEAIRTRLAEAWPHLNEDPVFLDQVAYHAAAAVCIAFGPLSTVPPAGTPEGGEH